jgi:SNF2 family DNA or RNA helicase
MLVCVPLSTMSAWQKEFEQWAPEMNLVVYNGNAAARQIIREYECYDRGGAITFNALLTNYEMVIKDRTFFEEVEWSNIVVDEAHRLKSEESLLYKVLVGIKSHHRLLLTGDFFFLQDSSNVDNFFPLIFQSSLNFGLFCVVIAFISAAKTDR